MLVVDMQLHHHAAGEGHGTVAKEYCKGSTLLSAHEPSCAYPVCLMIQEGLWAAGDGGVCQHAAHARLGATQALVARPRQRFRAGPRHARQRLPAANGRRSARVSWL